MSVTGDPRTAVRRAGAADVEPIVRMLVRAFFDDPVAEWACPHVDERPGVLRGYPGSRVAALLHRGEVWMTPGAGSAALWAAPDEWKTTPRDDLEISLPMMRRRLLLRSPMIGLGMLGLERRHPPSPPHWYLAALGTEPHAQGRGLGSATIAPVLEQCDRDGVGAYLESSKESNIDFYARFGFRVTRVIHLPRGPRMWPMWRDPR